VAQVGIRELLEAGVHFGHQTRRWNPKMRRFIHGENGGIYIIDLLKTEALLEQAQRFAGDVAHRGGSVLFVGTKKQARDSVKEIAEAAGQPYVNHRWLGGLLTNFQTISQRIKRLHDLERYESEGQLQLLPTRERMAAQADLEKLQANLGGVKHMQRPPDAMFVIDLKTEVIAVREAQRLRIPIIGLVDTNCDPDGIDYVIPGNDDAIRACALITKAIGDVVTEGRQTFRAEEEKARQEAEEQARREQEEKARREQEEKERAEREARERAEAEAALTQAGTGEPRDVAEAQVADAAQTATPQPEGTTSQAAGAAAQAATEPAAPASDTPEESAAKARPRARKPKADAAAPPAEAPKAEAAPEPAPEAAAEAEDKGLVDRAQDAANDAVDTAQGAAETAANLAEGAAEAVAERAPGPLGAVAGAAASAAGAVGDAVHDEDKDKKKATKKTKKDEDSK
jgi:small subunit ribosomal protein S2